MDEDLSGVSLRAAGLTGFLFSFTHPPWGGGASLAVVPYLMDPAMVLLERFAKRWTHGVTTPRGFAGYGLGVLDSLWSSQLNNHRVLF